MALFNAAPVSVETKEKGNGEKLSKATKKPKSVRAERASVYDAADGEQLFRDSGSSTYRDPSS